MNVKRIVLTEENGEQVHLYCKLCHEELMAEFYNLSDVQQLLRVSDCKHFSWIFVGDPFLDPPWDEDTRRIVNNAVAKADTSGGKYFLLPAES